MLRLIALVRPFGFLYSCVILQEAQRNLRLISTRLKKQAWMALDTHFSN
ncbi:hypothetical protein HanXRQr2_Chr12g0549101 [Helianthus annuus]|uniref:Uncharacterized protein n=1 Tax=Helianthus annuus TaxID=4232 RepID=A0A9K3HHR1_HELAN|nr:hypothetical protein HanXRQr2_Chr12g0549101 [Helianthus annuus]KAJ0863327.1 hypothetical protein HanPSC8_Chr12g0528661 [Helianthus annuus]